MTGKPKSINAGDSVVLIGADLMRTRGVVKATGRGRLVRSVIVELETPLERHENRPDATPRANRPEATT